MTRMTRDGHQSDILRSIAEEVPVSLEFNGIAYAVLMATPTDIDDLVSGFLIGERLQSLADAVPDVAIHHTDIGVIARANLAETDVHKLYDRVRHRTSDSSCGMCGIENIEQALRPLPRVTAQSHVADSAIFHALAELSSRQPLNASTGAVHAAAWVDKDGKIRMVREDVGRHNAFDKLIGAMRKSGHTWDGGFALLSSRCSYELVEKAVLSACPMLVTISAPTRLALEAAAAAGLKLRVLARQDSLLIAVP